MHHDRLARHELIERRVEQRRDLRVLDAPLHGVLLGEVVHPEHDGVDLRRTPVALELQFRELILQFGVNQVFWGLGEALVELAELHRKRLLRLDRRLHRLGGGIQEEKALAPDDFASFLVLHQRLGEFPSGELVERLELVRRGLGEAFELGKLLLGQHALCDERRADHIDVLHDICGDGLARRVQQQHVQLLDDALGLGLLGLRHVLRGDVTSRQQLVGVVGFRLDQLNRGPIVHAHVVEPAQRIYSTHVIHSLLLYLHATRRKVTQNIIVRAPFARRG